MIIFIKYFATLKGIFVCARYQHLLQPAAKRASFLCIFIILFNLEAIMTDSNVPAFVSIIIINLFLPSLNNSLF